jgi:8-oxo-dGTP pyrophosphatase MutT (NUDIX family)
MGGKVLLGKKKRGFGEGRWNGFGGKVLDGESIDEAMKREFIEEVGITPLEFEEKGIINFHFEDKNLQPEVRVFIVSKWKGKLRETEEMKPKWFDLARSPMIRCGRQIGPGFLY